MRVIYITLLVVLLWSYWRALRCARDVRTPFTPIMGWLVGLGYFGLAPLTILIVHDGYQIPDFYQANARYASVDLSDVRYVIPMLVVWLSLLLTFEAVVLLRPQQKKPGKARFLPLDDHQLKRTILVTLALSILDCAFTIWHAGGLESFLISHWYLREEQAVASLGDLFVLYTHFSLANQIVFTAAASLLTARQLHLRRIEWRFLSLVGLGLMLQMVVSGNRIFIALYGLSFLTACWLYQRRKVLVTLLILSPAVLLLFSAWAYFRGNLSAIPEDVGTYAKADLGNRVMTTLMDTTEGTNVMQLLHMVNDFGNKFDFFYGSTYLKAVTFIVPRRFYPNKPDNFPVQIARLYEPGEVTSLGTTQLGELYANFGMVAMLLLPLLTGLILLLSSRLLRRVEREVLLLAVLFLLCIWLARTSFEDNFITFLFAMLLIKGLRLQRRLCLPLQGHRAPKLATS
jgi:oligosaccharide repeat unit polymerase